MSFAPVDDSASMLVSALSHFGVVKNTGYFLAIALITFVFLSLSAYATRFISEPGALFQVVLGCDGDRRTIFTVPLLHTL